MKKKEVEEIVNRCTDFPVFVQFLPNRDVYPFDAYISSETLSIAKIKVEIYTMTLRRGMLNNKDDTWIKAIILHEVGHLETQHGAESAGELECYAQEWAISKAEELRWKSVRESLYDMVDEWELATWNEEGGKYRRYILAARLFRRRNK